MHRCRLQLDRLEDRLVPNQFDLGLFRRDAAALQLLQAVNALRGPRILGTLEYFESSNGLGPPRRPGPRQRP